MHKDFWIMDGVRLAELVVRKFSLLIILIFLLFLFEIMLR